MSVKISQSTDFYDYEILVRRRGENDYASYCPQLNLMINGTEHEQVVILMRNRIVEHINLLKKQHEQEDLK
ncbi:MAG: hypothetical protein N2517_06760 [Ignavibacteria bacterium]|nr:hypothetical protein [Ignavibacteria bacterium]